MWAGDDGLASNDPAPPSRLITRSIIGFAASERIKFAAPLYRGLLFHLLYTGERPRINIGSFDSFIKACIQRIDPQALRNSLCRGVDGSLFERQWQCEFHRAATTLLIGLNIISPDVGRVFHSDGYLDFYINGKLNWGVELLREGNRAQEHGERFQEGGLYATLLSVMGEKYPPPAFVFLKELSISK
jgi:hypothetical protein